MVELAITPQPCPFCGCKDVSMIVYEKEALTEKQTRGATAIRCDACRACGPELLFTIVKENPTQADYERNFWDEATKEWNERSFDHVARGFHVANALEFLKS